MTIFEDNCSRLKLIVSEVDGIISDGISPICEVGTVPYKHFYMRDFEAINALKKFCTFAFMSTDSSISYNLCGRKNIPFFWAKKSKKQTLIEIMRRYEVTPEEVLYLGCNFSDIDCIRMIPFSISPIDAVAQVRETSYDVLETPGGFGVISELYEMLRPELIKRA